MRINQDTWPTELDTDDIVVTLCDYQVGTLFPRHTHVHGQFAYPSAGVLSMFTDNGNWVVPAQRALWIPSGISHEMHMRGQVTIFNTYLNNEAVERAMLPEHCQVFGVSPLLRNLFEAALVTCSRSLSKERKHHVFGLLVDEIGRMPRLSLNVQLPEEPRLARACQRFLDAPTQTVSIEEMADWASMSRRTFTRQFRTHTGITFLSWRQQVCLLESLSRLGNGVSITEVSLELGYSSPSAFTALFRKILGDCPTKYLVKSGGKLPTNCGHTTT